MALPPAGVTLIADGSAAFNNALDQAAASLNSLNTAGQSVARSLSAFDSIFAPLGRLFDQLASRELRLLEMAFLRFINNMVVASFQGTAFADTLADLTTRMEGVVKFNLAPFWDQFNTLLTKAGPGIEAFINFASKTFADLGSDALTWGQNIVSQLAQGMLDAAGQVLDALINIGNMIAGFLMPGSPPKLLPDLDKWGTAAASVYLQAWTKADFSAFGEMSKEIEANLRSLSPTGKEKDINLIPTILGTREAIAQAVEQARETGTVTADSLDKIYRAAGAVTPVMKDYLQSAFNLELANKNLAAAQDNLNKVTEHYDDLLKPIDASLRQLDDAQKKLSDQQQLYALNLILKDPNATAGEKAQARLQIDRIGLDERKRGLEEEKAKAVDTANAKVEAAKIAQLQAQAQYDTQKGVIDLMTEQNKLLQEQEKLLDSLETKAKKAKAGSGKAGIQAIKPAFDLSDFIPQSIKDKLAELERVFAKVWDDIAKKFQPTVDAINKHLIPSIEGLLKAVQDKLPKVESEFAKTFAFMVDQSAIAGPTVVTNISKAIDGLTDIIKNHGDTIISAVGFVFRAAWTVANMAGVDLTANIATLFTLAAAAMDTGSLVLQGKWGEAQDRLKKLWDDFWGIQLSTADTDLTLLFNLFGLKWGDIKTAIETKTAEILNGLSKWLSDLHDNFFKALETLKTDWGKAWDAIQQKFSDFRDALIKITDPVAKAINGILTAAQGLFTWLQEHIFNFQIHLPDLPKWATPGSPTPFEMGLRGIYDALQDVNGLVAPALGNLTQMVYPPTSAAQMGNYSYANSNTQNLTYSPTYNAPAPPAGHDLAVIRAWSR